MIIILADDSCPFNNAFLFYENAISLQQNRLHRLSFLHGMVIKAKQYDSVFPFRERLHSTAGNIFQRQRTNRPLALADLLWLNTKTVRF